MQFFYKGWFWGEPLCKIIGIFDYITAGTEFLSVAMVALSKCVNLIRPTLGSAAGDLSKLRTHSCLDL